ncbi:MAG: flagellar accessory protein FlaH [Chloroflexi bacterium]|nr:flagellar accessory protein FlaH [Chloroflexota bacterium]
MTIENMTKGSPISTGNNEIDKKMGGGIPKGSLTLIEGASDAGKSVLSQQIIWGSMNSGCRASVFTTENTVKSLISQMQSLNLDVLDYFLLGWLKIQSIKAMKATEAPGRALPLLLQALKGQTGRDLVVVDSLTPFMSHAPVEEVISFFEDCKNYSNDGMSTIMVVHSYAFDDSTLVRISSLCDAHLRLTIETVGQQLVKSLEVAKVRGAEHKTGNIITFDVEPGMGMRIVPFSKARA